MLKKTGEQIRRRVAVLLAALMALSCLPAPALADEQSAEELPVQTVEQPAAAEEALTSLPTEPTDGDAAEVIASGTCGENLTWTLDSSGVLTVSGTGEMEGYNSAPWSADRELIQRVVIEEGVTSVGINAFNGCSRGTATE